MNVSIKYGIFLGITLIFIALCLYYINPTFFLLGSFFYMMIGAVVFMVMGSKAKRKEQENYISFGDIFLTSFIIGAIGLLMYEIFMYFLYNYIGPDLYTVEKEMSKGMIEAFSGFLSEGSKGADFDKGMQDGMNMVDQMDLTRNAPILIMEYFVNLIMYSIVALIVAAIVKKN